MNYVKVGAGDTVWQRPTDWLAMPKVGANEEVAYLLHAVWNTTVNPCALLCNGTGTGYTVDWGDGTITNYNFNVKAERNYVYANVTSQLSIRGYKTVLIKVTPQSGAVITNFNIQQRHTSYNFDYRSKILDLVINYNALTALSINGANLSSLYLESAVIKRLPANQLSSSLINISPALKYFEVKNQITGTIDNPFGTILHGNLKVKMDISGVTSISKLAPYAATSYIDLSEVVMPSTFTQSSAFGSSYGTLALPNLTNKTINGSADYMFWSLGSNPNYHTIPAINMSSVTSTTGLLQISNSIIQRVLWYGLTRTHSFANQLLDAAALNEIFTNLGTANSGATITITGNPGANTCNQSIATAKGWTVIN